MSEINNQEEVELLTPEDVARILKVDVQTVRRYTQRKNNPLPVIYLSPLQMRFKKDVFNEWLDNSKKEEFENVHP